MTTVADASGSEILLEDFRGKRDGGEWAIVNDGVMGGVSRSEILTRKDGFIFRGNISLENNGGFCSVRRRFGRFDVSKYKGLIITVTGDGKKYGLSLSSSAGFTGLFYNTRFNTVKDKSLRLNFPFSDFTPLYYGRPAPNSSPLDLSSIKEVSFIISDKQTGLFSLLIEKIELYL